jgi:hypothetical protein
MIHLTQAVGSFDARCSPRVTARARGLQRKSFFLLRRRRKMEASDDV